MTRILKTKFHILEFNNDVKTKFYNLEFNNDVKTKFHILEFKNYSTDLNLRTMFNVMIKLNSTH